MELSLFAVSVTVLLTFVALSLVEKLSNRRKKKRSFKFDQQHQPQHQQPISQLSH